MIPKIIHYCWFGGTRMPRTFQKFIKGWEELNPHYRIMKWDESNVPLKVPYLATALKNGNWANASNYVRLWATYNHGGIYMDTDVRLIKPLDSLLNNKAFFGFQTKNVEDINCFNNAFFGAEKENPFIKLCHDALLGLYDGLETPFLSSPHLTSFFIKQQGDFKYGNIEVNGIKLYSREFFYPYSWEEQYSEACITEDTIGIHYWDASWAK